MVGAAFALRDATEAKGRELAVVVVGFEDLADSSYGGLVLVESCALTQAMQRLRVLWISVGRSKVDSYGHGELHARTENFDEGGHLNPFVLGESD